MGYVTEPGVCTLSGPAGKRTECARALNAAGFTLLPFQPAEDERHPHRGLPAHRNPDQALEAGKPDSGHTPGSPHPDTEHPYEDDPAVGFIDTLLPERDGAVDEIVEAAAPAGFTLRLHSAPLKTWVPEFTVEQRLEIIEAHMAAIEAERG